MQLNLTVIPKLVKIGFPLLIISFFFTLLITVDFWIVQSFFGSLISGEYAFSISIRGYVLEIPRVIGFVTFPIYFSVAGSVLGGEVPKELTLGLLRIISYLLAFIVGIGFALGELLILIIFPSYILSLPFLYIFLVGVFFIATGLLSSNVLFLKHREKQIAIIYVSIIILELLMGFWLINVYGIIGVAISVLISYIVYGFVMTFFSLKAQTPKSFECVKWVLKFILPLIFCLLLIGGVWLITPVIGQILIAVPLEIIRSVLSLLVVAPFGYYGFAALPRSPK